MYDPEQDPRHIPMMMREVAELLNYVEAENELRESKLVNLEAGIERCDQLLELFALPAWNYLVALLVEESDELDTALKKVTDIQKWHMIRGEKIMCDWLLEMPMSTQKTREHFAVTHKQLLEGGKV